MLDVAFGKARLQTAPLKPCVSSMEEKNNSDVSLLISSYFLAY